jgi:hypothetical protein
MWDTNTLWFDTAVVLGMFAVGSILFGHFEEHKPKWRRLLKVAMVLIVIVSLSATAGRAWAFGVLALPCSWRPTCICGGCPAMGLMAGLVNQGNGTWRW